jgi:hypothetical protein
LDGNVGLTPPIDSESDDRDEALFVWGTDEAASYIVDDEIGFLVDQLKTDKVLIVHDSCNSGTSSRGAVSSGMPKELAFSKEVADSVLRPDGFLVGSKAQSGSSGFEALETRRRHALLAASRDEELSWTATGWPDRGGTASVFTYYLVSALESADERTTLTQLVEKVQVQTVSYTRKTYKEVQTPQVTGQLARNTIASILR